MNKEIQTYILPDHFVAKEVYQNYGVLIRHHHATQTTLKNRIILKMHMINILISGAKTIVLPHGIETISDQQLVLLTKGHILTSEVIANEAPFESIILYFSDQVLHEFLIQHVNQKPENNPEYIFEKDDFINYYVSSIRLLKNNKNLALNLVKLHELLLYLSNLQPGILSTLYKTVSAQSELHIQEVVSRHVINPVTVEELAFLCNMSLSTFKRKFQQLYNTTPRQWLIDQKLELAYRLLRLPENLPSTIYMKVGYQNHSSFTHAFKTRYGLSPSEYQQQFMNI
ncbi:helix-turn-helix transcriptional regulator [Zhouia sp. PK063]|uniref:helix-turn-helix transcriptional regulator n=1 Tax=Zhouia sp. PK063 TaxID=3373602 RepID=UPI003787510A